jgi:hypothetical protein
MDHTKWLAMPAFHQKSHRASYSVALAHAMQDLYKSYPVKVNTTFEHHFGSVTKSHFCAAGVEAFSVAVQMLIDENFARCDDHNIEQGVFVNLSLTPLGYTFIRRYEVQRKDGNLLTIGTDPNASESAIEAAFDQFVLLITDLRYGESALISGQRRT